MIQCTYYLQASELNPSDSSLNLNLAAVYFEKKDFDNCIKQCEIVLENTLDFVKKSRAFGSMAFQYSEQGNLEKSIEYFNKSLLENQDERIKDELRNVEKLKNLRDEERQINPELAEESNTKANELYKSGKYPDSVKEYSKAIKRNPKSDYTNRAISYIIVISFNEARVDCDKALELDPTFIRAYQRKAICHMMLKEFHRAFDTYDKGLKIKFDDNELMYGGDKKWVQ